MDVPETTPTAKRKRRPAPSVIEATSAMPMPVVAPVSAPTPESAQAADPISPVTVAAIEPATPPAAASAEPQKEDAMDADVTNTAQAQAETLFADANARATGAMEKGAKFAQDFSAFHKDNLEALVESGKIAARGLETLGQDVAGFAKTAFEQQTAAWKTLAGVKSPTEFLKVQGDMVRQSFDQMVAQGSRQTETMLKLAGEVAQPISNRIAVAAEKIKVAA